MLCLYVFVYVFVCFCVVVRFFGPYCLFRIVSVLCVKVCKHEGGHFVGMVRRQSMQHAPVGAGRGSKKGRRGCGHGEPEHDLLVFDKAGTIEHGDNEVFITKLGQSSAVMLILNAGVYSSSRGIFEEFYFIEKFYPIKYHNHAQQQ